MARDVHGNDNSQSDGFSPRLESFIADIGSGFQGNWLTVLQRTVLGGGGDPARYMAAQARIEAVARRAEHAMTVARAEDRALERARPIIIAAMADISRSSPGAEVTEQARIETCEHFTRWASIALALEGTIRSDDLATALDPFKEVIGIAGR